MRCDAEEHLPDCMIVSGLNKDVAKDKVLDDVVITKTNLFQKHQHRHIHVQSVE